MDELRTERLVLGPLVPEDLEHYAALYADPDVVRFIGDGTVSTREESAEWLERTLRRNAVEGWDMRTVRLLANGNEASVRVAEKLGMRFEREVLFHQRPTRMFALEV